MRIRRANSDDASAVARLGASVQQMHNEERPDWFKSVDNGAAVEVYRDLLADPAVTIYLAEEEDAVGFVVVKVHQRPDSPLGWGQTLLEVDQIGVAKTARRRGVGHALMNSVRDHADQVSAQRIILTTWEFNAEAHRFFEAEGLEMEMRRMSMSWPPR
jgi:GNAT superfamily N-acetyltransferase